MLHICHSEFSGVKAVLTTRLLGLQGCLQRLKHIKKTTLTPSKNMRLRLPTLIPQPWLKLKQLMWSLVSRLGFVTPKSCLVSVSSRSRLGLEAPCLDSTSACALQNTQLSSRPNIRQRRDAEKYFFCAMPQGGDKT